MRAREGEGREGGAAPGKPWGEGGRRDLSPQPEQEFYVPKYRALCVGFTVMEEEPGRNAKQLKMVTPGQGRRRLRGVSSEASLRFYFHTL